MRAIAGGRAGAHVSAFLALGSLALTLIVVVGRVLLLLCCNVNRTNSVELLTLHCSTRSRLSVARTKEKHGKLYGRPSPFQVGVGVSVGLRP